MKLTINTAKLQEMVSKAVRGASNNKLLPITGMLGINLKNGELIISTTDATNYLMIAEHGIDGDDFAVTVYADMFAKLIARLTCDTVSMELKDKYLEVTGNGTYKIELPFDENGEIVKFSNPMLNKQFTTVIGRLSVSVINTILNSVKPALAVTLDNPQYTNYWVGDCVLATDSYKIASYAKEVFENPVLISAQMMELLTSTATDDFMVALNADDNSEIMFTTKDCIVYGKLPSGLSEYAINEIKDLVSKEFTSTCEVNKSTLMQLLDRLSLFVRPFDDGNINLTFTPDGLVVTSVANSGSELIPYLSSDNFKEFACVIDINLLQTQVKSNISDAVKIHFGEPECIKITDGTITKIIALNG